MTKTTLPATFVPLLCTPPLRGRPPQAGVILVFQGQDHVLGTDLVARAASLSADALFDGGTVALGLHRRDGERLADGGFTRPWAGHYQAHLRGVITCLQEERGAAHTAETVRWAHGGPSAQERARVLLREVALTAQSAGLSGELRFGASDLSSYTAVRDAVWETLSRLQVAEFRQALVERGVAEARLGELPALSEALFEERQAQLLWQGEQAGTAGLLPVLKAMALGDLTLLSRTARAQLPPDRAERYQLGRLLGTAPRDRRAAPEPEPESPQPQPTATPTPVASAPRPIGPDGSFTWRPAPAAAPAPAPAPAVAAPGAVPAPAAAPAAPPAPARRSRKR